MTPEERTMLIETHDLVKENNYMIVKLVRSNRNSRIFQVLYWGVIIALSFGSILFIKPFLASITGDIGDGSTTQSGSSWSDAVKSFKDLKDLY